MKYMAKHYMTGDKAGAIFYLAVIINKNRFRC